MSFHVNLGEGTRSCSGGGEAELFHPGLVRLCMAATPTSSAMGRRSPSWTSKVCKIMAFRAVFSGFGPFFYIGVQVVILESVIGRGVGMQYCFTRGSRRSSKVLPVQANPRDLARLRIRL